MNIKVLVATHKNYDMPNDGAYLPVFVGNAIHPENNPGFQGDDVGENISLKNKNYNELTAIYWAWKNLDADAMGLVHYRRYLVDNSKKGSGFDKILSEQNLNELLNSYDVILPKKRNYYIESNFSHYIHAHHEEPLNITKNVIKKCYPDYIEAYDSVMNRTSAHMFNMFIMKKVYFDQYSEWMFDILGKVEDKLDISEYDTYEARVYGFISELLLDVWLEVNHPKSIEVPFKFMEKQNWFIKGGSFLKRKLF
ncbi:DUF4422 domain-containing protein [Latilactobacillus fragifolii]|uniref:DUF4422 domain-containing protein n=1 Tax=Latilactobacillus fragifolii TaxID=2814244 RepID=UPI001ABBCF36|nr:DUF4422 domain-containing protein [Latilactobacillus fragifolii]